MRSRSGGRGRLTSSPYRQRILCLVDDALASRGRQFKGAEILGLCLRTLKLWRVTCDDGQRLAFFHPKRYVARGARGDSVALERHGKVFDVEQRYDSYSQRDLDCERGSTMSRSSSPRTLNATTVRKIAIPGVSSHHIPWKKTCMSP